MNSLQLKAALNPNTLGLEIYQNPPATCFNSYLSIILTFGRWRQRIKSSRAVSATWEVVKKKKEEEEEEKERAGREKFLIYSIFINSL